MGDGCISLMNCNGLFAEVGTYLLLIEVKNEILIFTKDRPPFRLSISNNIANRDYLKIVMISSPSKSKITWFMKVPGFLYSITHKLIRQHNWLSLPAITSHITISPRGNPARFDLNFKSRRFDNISKRRCKLKRFGE